jgi:hypothetical protein
MKDVVINDGKHVGFYRVDYVYTEFMNRGNDCIAKSRMRFDEIIVLHDDVAMEIVSDIEINGLCTSEFVTHALAHSRVQTLNDIHIDVQPSILKITKIS